MKASTLTSEPVATDVDTTGWQETAGVIATLEEQETGAGYGALLSGAAGAAGAAIGGPYGGIVQGAGQVIGGLIDGKPQSGAAMGGSIGAVAGGALGALAGPAGAALGSAAGDALGGLVGGAIDSATRKPPKKKARAQARARANQKVAARLANVPAAQPSAPAKPATTAKPEPPKPADKPRAEAPAPAVASKGDTPAAPPVRLQIPAVAPPPPAALSEPELPASVAEFRAQLTTEQRARLDLAIREGRGAQVIQELTAERAAAAVALEADAARVRADEQRQAAELARALTEATADEEAAAPADRQPSREQPREDGYDDAAAPPAKRPKPRVHIGLIPLKRHQLEAVLVRVPMLRRLDARLLRAMTGKGSTVRDTAGIDPAARTYCAEPGETPLGIAKKLTGREERAAELLAANPGRRDADPCWRIPPGWMHFTSTDTGEADDDTSGTSRFYIIQTGDTPVGVATKSGAKAARPQWWSELKAANPQIPTTDGGANFERFFAGQQLWIPEPWPASPMFQQASPNTGPGGLNIPAPQMPSTMPQIPGVPQAPGLPAIPGTLPQTPAPTAPNTTIDPGVPVQVQGLLAYWAMTNPGAANPADYGTQLGDLTGTTTTRYTSVLASFQRWHNARNPAAPLRTDGVLDGATYLAIFAETAATIPAPGPGAVPWPKPQTPQLPQGIPQVPQGGIPGIAGGLPQLGGQGAIPNLGSVLIQVMRNGTPPGAPPPPTAPLPPGAVPGFHVAGQPPNCVWDYDGTMISLPPGMQPLDTIYGTPPANFVWQGGTAMPGPQNLPWVSQAAPLPQLPQGVPNLPPGSPWPWGAAPGQPPTQPAQAPAVGDAKTEPTKDSGAALPIAGILTALALSSS